MEGRPGPTLQERTCGLASPWPSSLLLDFCLSPSCWFLAPELLSWYLSSPSPPLNLDTAPETPFCMGMSLSLLPQWLNRCPAFHWAWDEPQHAGLWEWGLLGMHRPRAQVQASRLSSEAGSIQQLQPKGSDSPQICPQTGARVGSREGRRD